jgi:hypothetical protein
MKNSWACITSNINGGGIHTYIIEHELGENWSLYHKTNIDRIFYEILNLKIHIHMTETTIMLEFEEGNKNNNGSIYYGDYHVLNV